LISAFSWGWVSLQIATACSAALSYSYTQKHNFIPPMTVQPFAILLDSLQDTNAVGKILQKSSDKLSSIPVFHKNQSYSLSIDIQFFSNHSGSKTPITPHQKAHPFSVFTW
jgi:hypothetical protein